jgi:hypothetical protein
MVLLLLSMSQPPAPTDEEVIAAVRRIGETRQLFPEPRVNDDMHGAKYDIRGVCKLLATCTDTELDKSEPTKNPNFRDWIAVLKKPLEDGRPYYVKVAINVTASIPPSLLDRGRLVSFHPWRGR